MVGTKHCCWGLCKSDSRYPEKLPKSLKEMAAAGEKIFIPFAKPSQGIEKCHRWVNACSRENFTVEKVTKHTYICALHWPGERGPTADFPDPLKANLTKLQKIKASAPKRKAPALAVMAREETKKSKIQSENECSTFNDIEDNESIFYGEREPLHLDQELGENKTYYESVENGKMVSDEGCQTQYNKYTLSAKVDTMILRNEMNTQISDTREISTISNICYDVISQNSKSMKHFVGLTTEQFEALYNFLDDVCPLDSITMWKCEDSTGKKKTAVGNKSRFSSKEKLYICLLRLRRGFTIKTLSFLLSTPDRMIKETTVRSYFTTYIQLIYKVFRDMKDIMFPTVDKLRRYLPKVFKTMKTVRCSVDCTEFRIETSRNFARQGNTYSSYKHCNTFKCLIAVTPNGGACFVSDLFEGDIDDVKIFKESGILEHIQPCDMILADRGFTVQDLLNPLQAGLKIPPFLKGRQNLSIAEELSTRKISKARIHVERFNERLKQFRLIGRKIPLSLAPLATQMVVVASCLVNFQTTLCK